MSYTNDISNLQSNLSTQAIARTSPAPDHRTGTTVGSAVRTPDTTTSQADDAKISPESRLLSQALSLPDVRIDKVIGIQQALAAGTYRVSSADLAGKLIDTLQR